MFKPPIKKGGGGMGRVLPIATITNQTGSMMNKYVPGSGVGASSVAVRRLKLYRAATKQQTPAIINTVPGAPTITSVTPGYTTVTVYFSAPTNNGGNPITSYKITSDPEGIVIVGYSSPITVTGLTNGTTYTFTMVATNSKGDSAVSNASMDAIPDGSPPVNGAVRSAVSFYDNADLGFITLYGIFSRMCIDSLQNVLVASYARTGLFTINSPAEDGITQIVELTDTFTGNTSVSQGINTYYMYNIEVIKYNSDSVAQWVAKISANDNKGATIYDITSDSNNNIYALVGHATNIVSYYNSDGSLFGTLNNIFSFGNFLPARYCLIKYNSDGFIQWINTITAGDNNNQYLLINSVGTLIVDNNDNVLISVQVQRAGGGSGPTSIKFYKYASLDISNEIQFTLITSDSYPYNTDGQSQRGFLIKVNPSNNFDWIARMAIPGAYGEQNSGPINKNIVVDSSNNIYICMGTITSASSPICNIYSGVSANTNPLPLSSPYYRLDLRGNSLTPSVGQYYKFAAIVKFDNNGVFQRASCVHQMHNGSFILDMNPYIGIDKITNSLYLSMNAQGFSGTNAMTGEQLNKLYVNHFSSNNANASNYDIIVSNAYTMVLEQPQQVMAVVKYNSNLQAQTMAYINTPGGNAISPVSVDSNSNVYITTTIRDPTTTKTIYTYDSLSGSTPVFNSFADIDALTTNTDGLIVCYTGDLMNVLWAAPITSSDNLSKTGFRSAVDSYNNIYIGGTSTLDKNALTNTINFYNYDTVSDGYVINSLFGSMDVTGATDITGFIVKYT